MLRRLRSQQKKTVALTILCLALAVLSPLPASAVNESDSPGTVTEDKGGMFERAIASVLDGLIIVIEELERTQGLESIDKLVFNKGVPAQDVNLLPFDAQETEKLKQWYTGLSSAVSCVALIAVVFTAYKMMASGKKPQMRSEAMDSMWRWLWAIMFIAGAPFFLYIVFQLNTGLVETLQAVSSSVLGGADMDSRLRLTGSMLKDLHTGSVLGTAIVKLIYGGLEVYLNIIYMIRKYALMVIFVFTPIMVWMWALDKNVNAASLWLGEVISNAFMQTAHALVFLVFLTFVRDAKWLQSLIWALILVPLSEMIRNSVQGLLTRMSGLDEAGAAGRVMKAIGLGGVAGLANLAGASIPGGSAGTLQAANALGNSVPGMAGAGSPGAAGTGLNLSGMPVPGTIPTIATQSAGPSAASTPPAGYAATQSGLIVPSGAMPAAGLTGQTQGAQVQSQGSGLRKALETGRVAGGIAAKTVGVMAGVAFSAVPGGEGFARKITDVAGSAGKLAGGTASLASQTLKEKKESGTTLSQAFKNVVGGDDTRDSIKKASMVVGTHSFSPGLLPDVMKLSGMSSIDGFRWKR